MYSRLSQKGISEDKKQDAKIPRRQKSYKKQDPKKFQKTKTKKINNQPY
jgi:hypothetical protein